MDARHLALFADNKTVVPRFHGFRWRRDWIGYCPPCLAKYFQLAVQAGKSLRGASQSLVSLMVVGSFIPFFCIYACAWKVGRRITAAIGTGVTAVVLLCSAIPADALSSIRLFETKLSVGTLGMIGSAFLVTRAAR